MYYNYDLFSDQGDDQHCLRRSETASQNSLCSALGGFSGQPCCCGSHSLVYNDCMLHQTCNQHPYLHPKDNRIVNHSSITLTLTAVVRMTRDSTWLVPIQHVVFLRTTCASLPHTPFKVNLFQVIPNLIFQNAKAPSDTAISTRLSSQSTSHSIRCESVSLTQDIVTDPVGWLCSDVAVMHRIDGSPDPGPEFTRSSRVSLGFRGYHNQN